MTVTKSKDGTWKADCRPNGATGKRYRKSFDTKAKALAWEAWIKTQYATVPDWEPPPRDNRTLTDLAKRYHEIHGQHLKDGTKRKATLDATIKALGNPRATDFTATAFNTYRSQRIEKGIKANTVNHEHAYLRAMFNDLKRGGDWKGKNPLGDVRQMKVDETALSFLSLEQIKTLLDALDQGRNADAKTITLICLATGTRWSEAETLRGEQVNEGSLTLTATKNGKNRTVPITLALQAIIPKKHGRLFKGSYQAFQNAIKRAGIELPDGQMTHVLRHTFASHFMMNGGNILVLQKILGHQSLTMTMRYAHLAPDHLNEAKKLNPVEVGHFMDTTEKGR